MAGLSRDEHDALQHWSAYGQPGDPVTERYIPDDSWRSRLKPFVNPANGDWPDIFDDAQTRALLNGFGPGAMEDKWLVYCEDLSDAATTTVHFHRSWTGVEVFSVDLQLIETGSRLTRATWEMDDAAIKSPSEAFARESFVEVCRWVLRMKPAG
ncbi:MAG: hypothetical protein ABJA94_07150 [Rhodoglobus sp.]